MPSNPRPKGLPRHVPAWAWKWLKWKLGKGPHPGPAPKPAPKPKPAPAPVPSPKPAKPRNFTMYDSVDVNQIPKTAKYAAGYVGGQWPTYANGALKKRVPKAKLLSIAVASYLNADALDIEPGDAPPNLAPGWLKRQHALGKKSPVLYINIARAQALVDEMRKEGFVYGKDYLLWTAHYYSPKPHICGPQCGFGMKVKAHATQYWDKAAGKNLDVSLCTPAFLAAF